MAEIDVAKRRKVYIVSALGMTLIHTECCSVAPGEWNYT